MTFSKAKLMTVIPTKSAVFTALIIFCSSKESTEKSSMVTLSPSSSRIFAIYSKPSGGASPL